MSDEIEDLGDVYELDSSEADMVIAPPGWHPGYCGRCCLASHRGQSCAEAIGAYIDGEKSMGRWRDRLSLQEAVAWSAQDRLTRAQGAARPIAQASFDAAESELVAWFVSDGDSQRLGTDSTQKGAGHP